MIYPFADTDEMDRMLIANYNSVVHKNDTVYLLGDICFRIGVEKANKLIASMNGKKYLIKGNHDKKYDESLFEDIRDFMTILLFHDNEVDFIVTHCCSSSMQACIGEGMYKPDALTKYFQEIERTVKFKKWFFGHYHDNRNLAGQKILLYEQLIRIA